MESTTVPMKELVLGLILLKLSCRGADWKEMHPESASRPAYSSLENAHLAATIGNKMRPWQEALATYLATVGRG